MSSLYPNLSRLGDLDPNAPVSPEPRSSENSLEPLLQKYALRIVAALDELEGAEDYTFFHRLSELKSCIEVADQARTQVHLIYTPHPMPPYAQGGRRFPPQAVVQLRRWLREHRAHPYPDGAERSRLQQLTGLSLQQIATWMINARGRAKKRVPKRSLH
eukprot:EG_transcript_27658